MSDTTDGTSVVQSDDQFLQEMQQEGSSSALTEKPSHTSDTQEPHDDVSQESSDTKSEPESEEKVSEFDENHDPDATLKEDSDEDNKSSESSPPESPQYQKDAENLAKKWDSLDDSEQAKRIANLYHTRPRVLEAFARELGTTIDTLLDQYGTEKTEKTEPPFDIQSLKDELREELRAEMQEEFRPALQQAERERLTSEISKWGQHNKLSQDQIDQLNHPESDLRKSVEKIKFHPETGEKLSVLGRMRLAISNSESLQNMLIERGAIKRAKGIIKAINTQVKGGGGSRSASDLLDSSDDTEFISGLRAKGNEKVVTHLYAVFTNPFFHGEYEWNGTWNDGGQDPMITPEDFDKAQFILGRKGKPRNRKHEHAFTGIVRCGECGCMITAEPPKFKRSPKNGDIRVYNYLRCTKSNKQQKCSQKYVRVEEIEAQINEILNAIEIPEEFTKWAFKQLRKENKQETSSFAARRSEIRKKYDENEVMIDSLVDKLVRNVINDEVYQTSLKRYEERRRQLKKELNKYERSRDDWLEKLEEDFNFASTARKRFAEGDVNIKREIFSRLGSNFLLENGEVALELKKIYFAIKKGKEKTHPLISKIEPLKNGLNKPKNSDLNRWIPVWSTLMSDGRTLHQIVKRLHSSLYSHSKTRFKEKSTGQEVAKALGSKA